MSKLKSNTQKIRRQNKLTKKGRSRKMQKQKLSPINTNRPLTYDQVAMLPDIVCSSCGHNVFFQAVIQKQMPVTHPQNHSGKSGRINVSFLLCAKCGQPDKEPVEEKEPDTTDSLESKPESMEADETNG
jgi:hypothetical protein